MRKIHLHANRLDAAMKRSPEHFNENRLAKAIGAHPSRVASWRKEEHLPSADHLFAACELLGVPPQYLFGETAEQARERVCADLVLYGLDGEAGILIQMKELSPADRSRLAEKVSGWIEAMRDTGPPLPEVLMPHDYLDVPLSAEDEGPRKPPRGRGHASVAAASRPATSPSRKR